MAQQEADVGNHLFDVIPVLHRRSRETAEMPSPLELWCIHVPALSAYAYQKDVSSVLANRDSIWRILKAEGLSRRSKPLSERPAKGQGTFRDYDLGFVHIDIKHLPELQTSDGERRKRYLFVAIDRCSRSVHLAVKDDETEKSARCAPRRSRWTWASRTIGA